METKGIKNIAIYGLAFVFLLNVVYGGKPFAFAKTGPVALKSGNSQVSGNSQPAIKVVSSLPAQKIITNTNILSAVTSCTASGEINLNQPANCFSLSVATRKPVSIRLFVRALQTHQQVVVSFPDQKIEAPDYSPATPGTAGIPTLPASLFIFTAAALIFRGKLLTSGINFGNKLFVSHQSYYIIPMRC